MRPNTTTCGTALGCLLDFQQTDGGWAYSTHSSWTEPTSYSIMAVRLAHGPEQAIARGCEWLARRQRRDGGWSPGASVEKSTQVTSLAVLALTGMPEYAGAVERGVEWLLAEAGAQGSLASRFARWVMGAAPGVSDRAGWPWFPGAASWVVPTSLAICALSRQAHGRYRREIAARVEEARRFLLSRRCPDQGWNHGGRFRAGEMPESYPETTGIALLALAAARNSGVAPEIADWEIERSLRCGERHLRNSRSSEGECWLRLGLLAHGREVSALFVKYRDWTVNQMALRLIAHAGRAESNPFISHV